MILKKIRFFFLFFLVKPLFLYSQTPILGAESFGIASYYSSKLYGHKTANGEILVKGDLTCAHPKLPFGTMLEVTNLANKKWCIVRVNDRGPYTKKRILDVSHAAAARLGMFKSGLAKVKVTVVGEHNTVIISKPDVILENSIELKKSEEEDKIKIFVPSSKPKAKSKKKNSKKKAVTKKKTTNNKKKK
jgi:rare lipoprotein A